MKNSYQYFNAHANGAMQCMTSHLPTNPKKGSEGCNQIAISQCALLYRYLPHQFGYDFFKCISAGRVQNAHFATYALHDSTIVHKI